MMTEETQVAEQESEVTAVPHMMELDEFGEKTPAQYAAEEAASTAVQPEDEGGQEGSDGEDLDYSLDEHTVQTLKEHGYSDEILSEMTPELATATVAAIDRAMLSALAQQNKQDNNSQSTSTDEDSSQTPDLSSIEAAVKGLDRETYGDELVDLMQGLVQQFQGIQSNISNAGAMQHEQQIAETAAWFDKQFTDAPEMYHDLFGTDDWNKLDASMDLRAKQQAQAREQAFVQFMEMRNAFPQLPQEVLFKRVLGLHQPSIVSQKKQTSKKLQKRSQGTLLKPRKSEHQREDRFLSDYNMMESDFERLTNLAEQYRNEA